MTFLTSIVGWSLFGLASRFGQLGIQKRNLMSNPGGHSIAIAVGGFVGYWAQVWNERSVVLIAQRQAQIEESRQRRAQALQSQSS